VRDHLPNARWDPIAPWATTGPMRDLVHLKVVWHTTQGSSYPRTTYERTGGVPHYTIDRDGTIYQHYRNSHYSRALLNLPGGVETNLDGAIQVEIVGYAGEKVTKAQRASITRLSAFFTAEGIPGVWLNGAPTKTKHRLVGVEKMSLVRWDFGSGHCGHIDVPENNHWDPAFVRSTRLAVEEPWRRRRIRERIKVLRARIAKLREKL